MTAATTELRYFAAGPLTVEFDGERSVVEVGQELPHLERWPRESLDALLKTSQIVEIPVPTAEYAKEILALLGDEDLIAETTLRGYKVTRAQKTTA